MSRKENVFGLPATCARELSSDVLSKVRDDLGAAFREVKNDLKAYSVICNDDDLELHQADFKEARHWNMRNMESNEPVLLGELLDEAFHRMMVGVLTGDYPAARTDALRMVALLYHHKLQIAQVYYGRETMIAKGGEA